MSVPLAAGKLWKLDPLNAALAFRDATECEIGAVLFGLTRLKILGDFTQVRDPRKLSRAGAQQTPPSIFGVSSHCIHVRDLQLQRWALRRLERRRECKVD